MIKYSQKTACYKCATMGNGVRRCNLYNPNIINPKDMIVAYKLCDKNIRCPYKLLR